MMTVHNEGSFVIHSRGERAEYRFAGTVHRNSEWGQDFKMRLGLSYFHCNWAKFIVNSQSCSGGLTIVSITFEE